MQALLGLLFFSLLLTTGASLQCEICTAVGRTCSSDNVNCDEGFDICAVIEYESSPPNVNVSKIRKECLTKIDCEAQKGQKGTFVEDFGKIKKVECNKAPAAAVSLFLAFSTLLLMKILL